MVLTDLPSIANRELSALAFDFGLRRIGVAHGQTVSGTAQALPLLKARDGIPRWEEIAGLIETWKPDVLVVGLPFNIDGSESELMLLAKKFGNRLEGRFGLPCYGMDERLSSHAAAELQEDSPRDSLDSLAARLILESWFAELNRTSDL